MDDEAEVEREEAKVEEVDMTGAEDGDENEGLF